MSLNTVVISGRLATEPDIKATGSGVTIGKVSIAVNEFYKGKEKAHFFNAVAFGKTAEILRDHTQKGTLIGVEGTLKQERWETKEGGKRSKVVIYINRIEIFDGFKQSEKNSNANNNSNNNEDYGIPF